MPDMKISMWLVKPIIEEVNKYYPIQRDYDTFLIGLKRECLNQHILLSSENWEEVQKYIFSKYP
jgi:hypothetical protein